MNTMKVLTRVVLPVAILAMGLFCAVTLVKLAPTAERGEPPARVSTVQVMVPKQAVHVAQIEATGAVTAEQQIVLTPEVGGKVVWVSDKMRTGGRFAKNDVLARIDGRDYAIAVAQEESRVRQAELEYQLELGRQDVAKREWELLGDKGASSDLALRVPHLALAEQSLEAAKSGLKRAQLNESRTSLRAPFNAIVATENVDVGQVVGAGTQVATLIGTDAFRIEVSVPVERLGMLRVPGTDGGAGSPARVVHKLSDGIEVVRTGHVSGLGGQLDPQTRTAKVLVSVDSPLDPEQGSEVLYAGAYVTVHIAGEPVPGAFEIPRRAVRDGHFVWVADKQDTLRKRSVGITWRGESNVYVTEGLSPGDRVVVSPLPLPVEGMPLEVSSSAGGAVGDAGRAQQ